MEYIDKEKLIAEVNALSPKGEVRVTAVDFSGQDPHCYRSSMFIHLILPDLMVTDAVLRLSIHGETYRELYNSMVQAINDKLDELAAMFKRNRLKPKLWNIRSYQVCAKCGGTRLYSMEFRMDVLPQYDPINEGSPEIKQEDVPRHMGGSFCMDCESFCETVVRLGKMPGAKKEEEDDE